MSRSFRGLASRRRCLLIRGHRGGSKETIFPRELSVWAATSVGIGFCNFAFPLKIVSPEAMATRESWGAARDWTRAAPRESSRATRPLRPRDPRQPRGDVTPGRETARPRRDPPRDPRPRPETTTRQSDPDRNAARPRRDASERPRQKRSERPRRAAPATPQTTQRRCRERPHKRVLEGVGYPQHNAATAPQVASAAGGWRGLVEEARGPV